MRFHVFALGALAYTVVASPVTHPSERGELTDFIGGVINAGPTAIRESGHEVVRAATVDESSWANEDIPAYHDAKLAKLIAMNNVPEPWDHL